VFKKIKKSRPRKPRDIPPFTKLHHYRLEFLSKVLYAAANLEALKKAEFFGDPFSLIKEGSWASWLGWKAEASSIPYALYAAANSKTLILCTLSPLLADKVFHNLFACYRLIAEKNLSFLRVIPCPSPSKNFSWHGEKGSLWIEVSDCLVLLLNCFAIKKNYFFYFFIILVY